VVAGQVGWHTAVWFERQKYPWPLAQRENLFALHMEPSDGGDRLRIVQCSIELPSQPLVTHTLSLADDFPRWAAFSHRRRCVAGQWARPV